MIARFLFCSIMHHDSGVKGTLLRAEKLDTCYVTVFLRQATINVYAFGLSLSHFL
jgi:hypothetical protein